MIPKIIHQIWIGNKRIPKHISEWMNEIRDAYPDFEYHFWSDYNMPDMPDQLLSIYNGIADPTKTSAKTDLLRMYVVYKYGGFYLDADCKLIGGFSNMPIDLNNDSGFITYNDGYGIGALGCNFFGFSQNNMLLEVLIDGIKSSDQWLGPNYWSNILIKCFGYESTPSYDEFVNSLSNYNVKLIDVADTDKGFQHIALASWYPNSEWNVKLSTGDYE